MQIHTRPAARSFAGLIALASLVPGTNWQPTLGPATELDGEVHALQMVPEPGGPALYAAGSFQTAGGLATGSIARFDGAGWSALGGGVDGPAYCIATFDDGTCSALYVGGEISDAGGGSVNNIARWDGSTWSGLGSGIERVGASPTYVADLEVFDDGSGPSLFVCGWFNLAGGRRAQNVARWDGASWHAVGRGTNNGVFDLAVFDDGSGPALYAAGFFTEAGGVPARGVARWDGSSWTAVGDNLAGGVNTLCVYDDGTGPSLYAGGMFRSTPWAPEPFVDFARFDGVDWVAVGGEVVGPYASKVNSMCVYDDGSGPALFVGGLFWEIGGIAAECIGRWDGEEWTALGRGVNDRVDAMAVSVGPGGGRALYVGGAFTGSPAGDAFLSSWQP